MHRRIFLQTTAAALAATGLSADPIPLLRISDYFNDLETLEARFLQIAPDGARSSGTFYIRRPGRARFEYDPPQEALVMAGGGQLAIFDGKSNTGRPEQYPLRRTPLIVILEKTVDLSNAAAIVAHSGTPEATVVVAQDPENPGYGRIELVFADDPVRLVEWTTVDATGARTRVVLQSLRTGHAIPNRLFSIPTEIEARGG